ncbi:MAG: 2-(1,2-epoxy-1,2-dihydrophenyl)acetyl-CoA isomerase [Candidatus Poriferisodalaceae bacterium]|jgi:2-(1,2-epoxy-1,2-dihydrophenyl)acetyl-CoA isomerase
MTDSTPIDTGTDLLLGRREGRLAILTFNRPEARNALHEEIYGGFNRVLPMLANDSDIGAVMLTGAGGAFCAGGDVKGMNARNKGATPAFASPEARIGDLRLRQGQVSAAIHEFPKVVVAAIPGAAAGAGLSIALACHVRIASSRALLTTAFAKVGFSGDFGGSWFLTQMLGAAKARELYLTADRLNAEQALALGMVSHVYDEATFEAEAIAYAQQFANGPTVAYRYMNENINRATVSDLRTCLDGEAVAMTRTGQTEDHKTAVQAFVDKATPTFLGR